MSRLLSEILNAPEPRFSQALQSWERLSGQSGHDIRLISDIVQRRKKALVALQLDETDTTPRELYFTLSRRAADTNHALEKELKISPNDSPQQLIDKIIAFIDRLPVQRDVWTVKHSVVKQLLKKQPPKKLLKILGLRSIDSVVKRTSAYELLALAYQIEAEEWTAKLRGSYKKLKPVDFQAYTSSMFVVDEPRVKKLHKGGYKSARIIVPTYETGSILIVPPGNRFHLDTLALTLALLQTLYDLRIHSAYFRLISVTNGFGGKLQAVLEKGLPGTIHELEIGWGVLQQHFSHFPASFEPIEQPHLQYADVKLESPINALKEVLPDIEFWDGHGHVFMAGQGLPVSMHLMDVVINASNKLSYENRTHAHLRQRLWEELGLRYAQHVELRNIALQKIEDEQF